jgi:L-threonylcarbamoyladenylate synthase
MKQQKKTGIFRMMNIADLLGAGGVGIMPTDTIYGIVGSALDKKAVERIYRLRKRDLKKPMIILIAGIGDLKLFGVKVDRGTEKNLKDVWPGKVSVILPCPAGKFSYLHRGTKTLAFRLPKPLRLRELLRTTGPLVAPSANLHGMPPARTIAEAKKYFADKVDFYADAGRLHSKPSTLIKIEQGRIVVVRA